MPSDARELLSVHALQICLQCHFEAENLDFKRSVDLLSRRGVLELAKDVMALANTVGGYIVVGVEDKTFRLVGITDEAAEILQEGKTTNDKLRFALQDKLTVQTAVHCVQDDEGVEKKIALICVYPRERHLPAPTDGTYDKPINDKRTEQIRLYERGVVFIRKADVSTRATTEEDYVRRPYSMDDFLIFHDPKKVKNLIDFPNPYDFSIAARSEMFKGREREVNQMLMSAQNGVHMSVFGLQRIGKTSLVEEAFTERVSQHPSLKNIVFATVNLQELGSKDITYKQLLDEIILTIGISLSDGQGGQNIQAAIDQFLATPRHYRAGDKKELFKAYEEIIETVAKRSPRQIVLFLDEFSELCRVIEKNDNLASRKLNRNELLHPHEMLIDVPLIHSLGSLLKKSSLKRKLTFIFAIRPFVAEYDRDRDLQLLKLTKPINIGSLDERAAKRLIQDPTRGVLSINDPTVDYLYRLTAGHPFLIQFMMQELVDDARINERPIIRIEDIKAFEHIMVSDGPSYEAQFELLDSDYSVDEVINPKTAELGRGALALISKIGAVSKEGWVGERDIKNELVKHGIGEAAASDILKKFQAANIIETETFEDKLHLRVYVPLLRKRYVAQNMYQRYFRDVKK